VDALAVKATTPLSIAVKRIVSVEAPAPKAVVEDKDGLWIAKFNRADDKWNQARVEHTMLVEDTFQSRDNWSYVSLVEELRRISEEPEKDAAELFRRMCFNALISNTDDHPRNHAFIAKDKNWRLSPAYDLTPFTPISNERRDLAMICGDQGRFCQCRQSILTTCKIFAER